MGPARIFQITDLGRINADLGMECRGCGRVAVFDTWEAARWYASKGLPTVWPPTARPFRCRCGSRDVRAVQVQRSKRPNPMPERPLVLQPMYVIEPDDPPSRR